jgi:hypothetical protein
MVCKLAGNAGAQSKCFVKVLSTFALKWRKKNENGNLGDRQKKAQKKCFFFLTSTGRGGKTKVV